jgi:tetratricopeptide (TPR) repeat protein
MNPRDLSTLAWLPPVKVSACPDEKFKQEMIEFADRSLEISQDPSSVRRARIPLYLALGELDKAKVDFAALLTPDNKLHNDHYTYALLCLLFEDHAKYHESCRTMLERLADVDDPLAANFAAWTCALLPHGVDDYSPAIALAASATAARPENHQFLNTQGAVLYRAGRHQEALDMFTELDGRRNEPNATANSSPAYTWYFLAMTHHALGQSADARRVLNQANDWTELELAKTADPPPWNRRLTLELLRSEANQLIAGNETQKDPRKTDDPPSPESPPRGNEDPAPKDNGD